MKWRRMFQPHVVVTAAVVLAGSMAYNSVSPPSRMLSATEDDGVAVIGGQMVIKYHNVKRRYCRNNVTRWLYNPSFLIDGQPTPLWIPLGMSAAPPIALGDQRYAVALTIPPTALPGDNYHYTATTDYSCGLFNWLEPPSVRSPDMVVRLVRPTPDTPPRIEIAPPGGAVTVAQPPEPK